MRISSWSRVMPALLTRIETGANSLAIASTSASTAAPSQTSSTRPWPPSAARRSPIAAAPFSLVAVPMTVAPRRARVSAMAAPMPRLAPVTRAISPASGREEASVMEGAPEGSVEGGGRGAQRQSPSAASKSAGVPSERASRVLSMRLARPESTLPGPHSATRATPRVARASTHWVQRTGR